MEFRKLILSLVVAGFTGASTAHAGAFGANSGTTKEVQQCGPALTMTSSETEKFLQLNNRFRQLEGTYGTPNFEAKLKAITDQYFPSAQMMSSVTPTFFKRMDNLVAQQRLRNLIAKTIGLNAREWVAFDAFATAVALYPETGTGLKAKWLDKSTTRLIQVIKEAEKKATDEKLESTIFEDAFVSVAEMYAQLMELRAINGEILSDSDLARYRMVIAGAVFAGASRVVWGTVQYGGKIVDVTGRTLQKVSKNPAIAKRFAYLGEVLGGAIVGTIGAPAVHAVKDSYQTVTNAWINSVNNNTAYGCELNKQMTIWADHFAHNTVHAMKIGAGFGAGGGAVAVTAKSAAAVLHAAWASILVAQGYSLGKMTVKGIQAYRYYADAQQAALHNDDELSEKLLRAARASAQESGDAFLDSVIVATLTVHVGHHRKEAFAHGASEIRKLYAASADTIPSAVNSVFELSQTSWELASVYYKEKFK